MATIRIDIQSDGGDARRQLQQVQQQVVTLNEQIARNNRLAVDATGNARESLREQNQRLRAERGLLTAQRQRLNLLLPGLRDEIRATREASQATRRFSGVLNEIGGVVGGIGIAELAFHIQQFATNSVRAAAELQGFQRGLQIIEGTNAPNRLQELIEVANLPGLQLAQLINYNNRLRAIGLSAEEVDSILLTTGQTILAMGGTSDIASQAVEQLVQALQTNTVSLQDFRSIAQRIPGFYQAIAATHDVEASIDGFRVAVDNAGGSVKDALLPVMDELARRFGSPPADSYVVAIDGLQNSFFLLQAEIGNNLLPILAQAATGLSQFFDAIRENNLDELPAPIQAIVSGAQSLYNALISVGETIANALSPEVSQLLPALGGLLGNVLELAGALVNALRPAFDLIAPVLRVSVGLIVQLANDIGGIIGGLTDFVNWITGAETAQQGFNAQTQQTAMTVQNATTAVQGAGQMTGEYGQNLTRLQGELARVNTELDAKRQRLDELSETATSTAHPAVQQLTRQVADLETQSATLTGQIGELRNEFTNIEMPAMDATTATRGFVSSIDDFGGALGRVDTRFLTFHERTAVLSGAIRELPPAITAVRTEFDALAPTVERVNAIFDQLNTSLVDTGAETTAFAQIYRELQTQITSYAADQAIANAEARLVSPAVTDAANSMRDYVDVMDDVGVRFRDIEGVSEDVTNAVRDQESAFDDLRTAADAAELSLDALDTTFNEIPNATNDATEAFRDFSLDAIEYIDDITRAFSPLFDTVGDVGAELENFTTLITSLATGNVLGVISSTANIIFPGITDPQRILDFSGVPRVTGDPRQIDTSALGLTPVELEQLDFSGVAPGLRALLGLEGGGEGGFNVFQARSRTEAAQRAAEATGADRQAIEDVAREQYGAADYAAEVAAATGEALQGSVEPPDIAEIEADQPQSTERETRDQARAAEQMRRDEERRQRDAQREAQRETRDQARAAEQMRRDEERRQRDAQREAQRETRDQARAEERARAEAARAAEREAEQAARAEQDRLRTAEQERQEAARAAERAEAERIRAAERVADAQEREERDRLRAAEREAEQVARAEQDRLRAAERAEAEQRRIAERAERDRLRAAERTQQIAEQEERDRLRAAENAERERTQLIEREQRERQRLAERQQREAERANEQRIREEMRLQERIDDLRDDAVENQERRQDRLADLAEEHQDRLTDIERSGLRAREDLQREFSRDIADINQEAREQIARLLQSEGIAAGDINRFLSGLEGNVRSRLSASGRQRLRQIESSRIGVGIDLNRQRGRDAEDLRIRQERAVEAAQIAFTRSQEDINAQAQANATALREALTPLLEMQGDSELAATQSETAMLQSTTATTQSETATLASETAVTESTNAERMTEFFSTFADIPEHLRTAGDRLFEAGDHIIDGISGSGLQDAALALQTVAENFHVLVTGNSADVRRLPAGSAPPVLPPTVTQPAPTTPQGNQMAVINMEFPDGTIKELRGQIVQQQQDGRSL